MSIKNLNNPICFGFIFNTLKRNESDRMGHWISLHIIYMPKLKCFNLKFADSFKQNYEMYGEHVSSYISNLRMLALKNNVRFKLEYVPFVLQSSKSKVCSAYAIYTLMQLIDCNQKILYNFFSDFDSKKLKKMILKWQIVLL